MHDIDDSHAEVRFNARYKVNGRTHKMQENSHFVREQGRGCMSMGMWTANNLQWCVSGL